MFRRNTVPQRQPFSFQKEDVMEDIEAIKDCEDQRNKLYWCLDEKPPQEHKFSRLEEFLKGTNNLEDVSKTLADMVEEINVLKQEIKQHIVDIKNKASSASINQCTDS